MATRIYKPRSGAGGGGRFGIGASNGRNDAMPPAIINTRQKAQTVQGGIDAFTKEFSGADREYGTVISNTGATWSLTRGQAHSVSIDTTSVARKAGRNAKLTVVHNHPSGNAYSPQDLGVWAYTQSVHSIVAVGRGTKTYQVSKTSGFDTKGFVKAFNKTMGGINSNAEWNKRMNSFLKSNQKNFGYTYSRIKTKVPRKNNTWDTKEKGQR